MKIVLFVFSFILFSFNFGFTLKCWLCVGSLESDCLLGKERAMVIQECGAALRNVTTAKTPLNIRRDSDDDVSEIIVASCVSFIIEQYGAKMIERSCSFSYEGVDVCDYISEVENVLMCDSCNEDKCNFRTNIQTINVQIITDE